MKNNCPNNDLLKYINEALKNPQKSLPKNLIEHANKCDRCNKILTSPEDWEAFISICEHNRITQKSKSIKSFKTLKEGLICRIKIPETSNSVFILITDTSSLKNQGYIRVSPIYVSPLECNLDKETDIIIPANRMPTGLPSLIEWWNDRPIMAETINKIYGSLNKDDYNKIKNLINLPIALKINTKSILIFREIEKAKGNQMSASFFEKFISKDKLEDKKIHIVTSNVHNDKLNNNETKIIPSSFLKIYYRELFSANEELRVAAASKDVYSALKEYLKNSNNYEITRINDGSNSFTIASTNCREFTLIITYKNKSIKELKSNPKGKLYLKEGLEDFEKIEFKQ